MADMELDKRLTVAEHKILTLQKIEKQVGEIHNALYKNGLSSKVNELWCWKGKIEKVIVGVLIVVFGALATAYLSRPDVDDRLSRIETKIESLKR